jgi:NAD+ kinase
MRVTTVGVVAHPALAEAAPALRALAEHLHARGARMCLETRSAALLGDFSEGVCSVSDGADVGRQADIFVVLGGDGTLLGASHLIERSEVPVIGVNFGSLGFFTELMPSELLPAVDAALAGECPFEERRMLRAVIRSAEGSEERGDALNDVVVSRTGLLSRIIELEVVVDGLFVSSFRADGLIVASPTGSTAYSLAAGGPILHPNLRAVVITPICPHTLTNRPLVLGDDACVEIWIAAAEVEINVTLDGQRSLPLAPGSRVIVTRSPRTLRLARAPKREYYEVLRTKLRWGETGKRRETQF